MRAGLWSSVLILQLTLPSVAAAQAQVLPAAVDVEPAANTTARQSDGRESMFRALFADFGRELSTLPSKSTAITLGLGGVLAMAVHPNDHMLTRRASQSESLDAVFDPGETAGGGWAHAAAAFTTFAVGRATGNQRVQAVGADLVQAQILTAMLTQGIKFSVNRTRPDNTPYSFPSGHTSGSFATATVLSRHFGWKVGLPAYGFASYVAASRLQENRHFASDVIFGAAVGILAGRTVTVGRGEAKFAMAPMGVPGGGIGVAFTRVR